MGILTVSERIQPTLPGVEEAVDVQATEPGFELLPPEDRAPAFEVEPPAPPVAPTAASTGPRTRPLLRVRRHHAAGRHVPRLPELRRDERLLVVSSCN